MGSLFRLLRCGSAAAVLPGLAPWYCPPRGLEEDACVRQKRYGEAPLYIEGSLVPLAMKVVLNVASEVSEDLVPLLQAMVAKIEAVRILVCTGRFEHCYKGDTANQIVAEICGYIDGLEGALEKLSTGENLCQALFASGGSAMLRGISTPLQRLVELALPSAAPAELGNFGSRFHFEHFFQERAKALQRGDMTMRGRARDQLLYPPIFSPLALCSFAEEDDTTQSIGPDALEVLRRLGQAKVPLSRSVVNFGAADGVCGIPEDWNFDPANCLAAEGHSALLVEGDQKWFPELRRRFGNRDNIYMVLNFLPLSNVTQLLRDHIATTPGASSEPDLLKVDVDHADCLFMEQALLVIRPKVIHLEFSPQAPPPMDYVQQYQPPMLETRLFERAPPLLMRDRMWKPSAEFIWSDEQLRKRNPAEGGPAQFIQESTTGREMTGCSLAAFLVRAPGYVLLSAGDEEAVLVRRDLQEKLGKAPSPWDAWLRGYFCNPWRMTNDPDYASWGYDFRALADTSRPLSQRRQELDLLLKAHGAHAYTLGLAEL